MRSKIGSLDAPERAKHFGHNSDPCVTVGDRRHVPEAARFLSWRTRL